MIRRWIAVLGLLLGSTAHANGNLVVNGGCEAPLTAGEIPGWVEWVGTSWGQRGTQPAPFEGSHYFFAGAVAAAELRQTIDLQPHAAGIDAGALSLRFSGRVRAYAQPSPDQSRIVLELLGDDGSVLETFDSGPTASTDRWLLVADDRRLPLGTRGVRLRLISTRRAGNNNDAYFDDIRLEVVEAVVPRPVAQPDTLRFEVDEKILPQPLRLINTGPGTLEWRIAAAPSWIGLAPDHTTSNDALVQVNLLAEALTETAAESMLVFATNGVPSELVVPVSYRRLGAAEPEIPTRLVGFHHDGRSVGPDRHVLPVRFSRPTPLTVSAEPGPFALHLEGDHLVIDPLPDAIPPGIRDHRVRVVPEVGGTAAEIVVRTRRASTPEIARCEVPAGYIDGPDTLGWLRVRLRDREGQPCFGAGGAVLLLQEGEVTRGRVDPTGHSGPDGELRFEMPSSACRAGLTARLSVGGGTSVPIPLRSFDLDGDCVVTLSDFAGGLANDYDFDAAVDDDDLDILLGSIGRACGTSPGRPELSLSIDFSPKRARIRPGDEVLVTATIGVREAQSATLPRVSLQTRNWGLDGPWSTLAFEHDVRVVPGSPHLLAARFQYPLEDVHQCFRVVVEGDRIVAAPVSVLTRVESGASYEVIDQGDQLLARILVDGEEVASIPIDKATGLEDYTRMRILGVLASGLTSICSADGGPVIPDIAVARMMQAAYLWAEGTLESGWGEIYDTALMRLALTLAELSFKWGRKQLVPGAPACTFNGCGPDPARGPVALFENLMVNLFSIGYQDCCNQHDCCYQGPASAGGTALDCSESARDICDLNLCDCMQLAHEESPLLWIVDPFGIRQNIICLVVQACGSGWWSSGCPGTPGYLDQKQKNTYSRSSDGGAFRVPVGEVLRGGGTVTAGAVLPPGWSYTAAPSLPLRGPGVDTVLIEIFPAAGSEPGDFGIVRLVASDSSGAYIGDVELRLEAGAVTRPPVPADRSEWLRVVSENPFRSRIALVLATERLADRSLRILDTGGRVVRVLEVDEGSGVTTVEWDGMTSDGRRVPPGLYFASGRFEGGRISRTLIRR